MTEREEFDLIVIGGGNAYRVAHKTARETDQRVALVERAEVGGTCPNRGCIPSKRLYVHARAANQVRRAGRFHVDATIRSIDADAILRDVKAYADAVDPGMTERLDDGVSLVRGHARFVGERELEVGDRRLVADRIVIATGVRPRAPRTEVIGDVQYWTNADIFQLEKAPASLVVVGGGFVGVEMATFFDALGVEVCLLQRGDSILPREDRALREAAHAALSERLRVETGVDWRSTERCDAGVRVTFEQGREEQQVEAEALLVAIGRVPNTDDLGLDAAGIATDDEGYVRVDERLRTSAPSVWALGDVRGGPQFTHTASAEAEYLVRVLTRDDDPSDFDMGPVPHAVFTDPPLASVGLTQDRADEEGFDGVVVEKAYDDAAMGAALKEERGLCKLLVERNGRIAGVHIVGEEAPTLLHEILPFLRWKNDVSALAELMHVHPALPELLQAAARSAVYQLKQTGA